MVADHQSSPRPRFTIGYALPPGKAGSVIQPPLEALAAERGMRLVAVDPSLPLADQGPFDLIIHKLFDPAWRARLEAFSALHPAVPVVDAPAAVDRLLDRFTMLDVVPGLAAGLDYPLSVPAQVTVSDAAALAADDPSHGLRFPLIAKPLAVDGSASSHDLCLVYRAEGLRGLHTPVVLQEFVNHGGVLFKVYVVGSRAVCVRRSSLPDVPAARLADPGADASVPFANISSRPALDKGEDSMTPPAAFVDQVARGLRQALGLHLLNFDMFAATELDDGGRRRYFLVDINYFPGFAKMPGYETALTDFFAEMIQLGTAGAASQEKLESVPCNGLDLEETGSALDSTCPVPMA
ncbi:inositol-tetrakisphosphate 1-kinase 4-like [Aegilops tauschii subsp. strangulata]|uniref:Inositol-tetrakisphosphate 1-kinase n=1 Tax=Triticum aestivum TaxID=4565 RepID=A0A3B6A086_WHEAT